MSIEVVPYDPSWPPWFEQVAATLTSALADVPATVAGCEAFHAAADLTDAGRRQILSLNDSSR